MKPKRKRARRQIFVFTPEEKKAAACVVAALMLGLATKHYRETHPRTPPPLSEREQYKQKRAAKAAAAFARSARGQRDAAGAVAKRATPAPVRDPEEDEAE